MARGTAAVDSTDGVLRQLQALADTHTAPRPRRLRFGWGSRPREAATGDLNVLVESLERESDTVARALIALETDKARLHDAQRGLDDALALIRACHAAVESAARELAIDQPERAHILMEKLAPRLVERERDVLTQLAITGQGVLALQLVADGQEALGQAIDRARNSSVAALRTAMAARRAISGNRDLLEQAQALERTVDAAQATPASGREVERALADALAQARRAIDAAQVSPRTL
ncbi:toxic anion resistance protein [Novosphingobium sp. Leaf2]|uniref:toxic anion resistance protein n=1 Tax=Novosphingobium sp. Leaf2 TaxID=1735670 RepID=UPI00138F4121|nr:toxic anion resistance protein [Novosphingobium sp. Leaf2]